MLMSGNLACKGKKRASRFPSGWHPDLQVPWSFGCRGPTVRSNACIQKELCPRWRLFILCTLELFSTHYFEWGGSWLSAFHWKGKKGKANTCLYLQGSHSKLPDASGVLFSPPEAWKQLTKLPLSYSAHLEAKTCWLAEALGLQAEPRCVVSDVLLCHPDCLLSKAWRGKKILCFSSDYTKWS